MIGKFRAFLYETIPSVLSATADDMLAGYAISQWHDGGGHGIEEQPVRPTVCIDLDGVLTTSSHGRGPAHVDQARPGALEFLDELHRRGYRVVIYTARDSLGAVICWLEDQHLLSVVEEVTNRELPAVSAADDRAIRFEGDFGQTLRDIDRLMSIVLVVPVAPVVVVRVPPPPARPPATAPVRE